MQQLGKYLEAITADRRVRVGGALKLRVLMLYEDLETGVRARLALEQALQRVAVETDLHIRMWKFDLLGELVLREQAVTEATEARIVFVSAHGGAKLPLPVGSWFEEWFSRKRAAPCALVVSLDPQVQTTPGETMARLETAARLAGVEMFLDSGDGRINSAATPISSGTDGHGAPTVPGPCAPGVWSGDDIEHPPGELGVFLHLPVKHPDEQKISATVEGVRKGRAGRNGAGG